MRFPDPDARGGGHREGDCKAEQKRTAAHCDFRRLAKLDDDHDHGDTKTSSIEYFGGFRRECVERAAVSRGERRQATWWRRTSSKFFTSGKTKLKAPIDQRQRRFALLPELTDAADQGVGLGLSQLDDRHKRQEHRDGEHQLGDERQGGGVLVGLPCKRCSTDWRPTVWAQIAAAGVGGQREDRAARRTCLRRRSWDSVSQTSRP